MPTDLLALVCAALYVRACVCVAVITAQLIFFASHRSLIQKKLLRTYVSAVNMNTYCFFLFVLLSIENDSHVQYL